MFNEKRFPYKWMFKVVEAFYKKDEPGKPLNTYKIARTIGSCSPDAGEVVKMIALLSSTGRVESVNGQWRKTVIPTESEVLTTGFNMQYIKQMMEVVKALPEDFISLPEFANENNLDIKETEEILLFLKELTQYGQIYLYRKFPQKWAFKTWK